MTKTKPPRFLSRSLGGLYYLQKKAPAKTMVFGIKEIEKLGVNDYFDSN